MNRPPTWSSREEQLLLLNAYLDNELDAASALAIERRINEDTTLKAEYDRLKELRDLLTAERTSLRASDDFRQRIAGIAGTEPVATADTTDALDASEATVIPFRRPEPRRVFDWRQLAAAAMIAAMIGSGSTYVALNQRPQQNEFAEIIGGHQRALLAAAPFDVASSDRHTVKPWFDSKMALSPQIIDLASEGFPLAGGRVDVIGGRAVPVMVYMRRAHVISVVALPVKGQKASDSAPERRSEDGYTYIRWQGRDFTYAVVSDLAENELDEFVSRWQASLAKG